MNKTVAVLMILLSACASQTPAPPTDLAVCQRQLTESEKDLNACLEKLEEVVPLIKECP